MDAWLPLASLACSLRARPNDVFNFHTRACWWYRPFVDPGDWGEDWPSYPGILDEWPPSYEDDEESSSTTTQITPRLHWKIHCSRFSCSLIGLDGKFIGGLTWVKNHVDAHEVRAIEQLKLNEFRSRIVAGSFPPLGNLAEAIAKLQFIQADPIRSPARAQDLMLRQRVDAYQAGDLERESPNIEVEEVPRPSQLGQFCL